MMEKIWLIITREYLTRVRKRSFLITTLLAPAGFALFFISVILLSSYGESKKRIVVVDESGYFRNKFADNASVYFFFSDSSLSYLEENFRLLNYDGILYIPLLADLDNPRGIQYRSDRQLGIRATQYIEEQMSRVLRELKMQRANIDRQLLKSLEKVEVRLESIIYGTGGKKQGDTLVATLLGYAMGFTIYMVLLIYGAMVMKGVMEEKTNRIIEVIACSVRPFQLMIGKILGVGAVGLTQFVLWFLLIGVVYLVLGIAFAGKLAEIQNLSMQPEIASTAKQYDLAITFSALQNVNFGRIIFYFLFYFLGGYFIYGALYAAIGSAINEESDSQSLSVVVSVPIVISIFIMMSAIQEPDSSLAVGASIFPFTAPVVMPARIPFDPQPWEIVLSMISVVVGFICTTWIAARIYHTGILMYGKKITLKEVGKWIIQSRAF
ncbi:MAG: ABC transporter permease [Chitinophagales bacterium]|nr:MAG: ABC transporter permease [Chitinophagales bacterium]